MPVTPSFCAPSLVVVAYMRLYILAYVPHVSRSAPCSLLHTARYRIHSPMLSSSSFTHAYLSPIAIALLLYTYLYTASFSLSFFGTCLWPGVHDQKRLAISSYIHIRTHSFAYIRSFDVFIVYFLALRICANFLFNLG